MAVGNVGRRYAQAVFDIAKQKNSLDQWATDLNLVVEAIGQREALRFLENPKVSRVKKFAFVQETLQGKISPEIYNLAVLLVQRGRQAQATVVAQEFTKLLNNLRGIETALVTTAIEMTPQEEAAVKARLSQITNKQVEIKKEVDPSIIGGVVARVGDTLIDGSIKSRLEALRKALV
jgi:F-type H+-transporting ATPase subunit delta